MNTESITGPNPMNQGIAENAKKFVEDATRVKTTMPELQQVKAEIQQGNKGAKIDAMA